MPVEANLIGEAIWVNQYQGLELGIVVNIEGVPDNPDGNVLVSMETISDDESETPTVIFSDRVASTSETGVFTVLLGSVDTQAQGFYKVTWDYAVAGESQTFSHLVEVIPHSVVLEDMDESLFSILDSVWIRFADLFDSPFGGPHFTVYYQTRFNRGRVAELMASSLRKLNVVAQPVTTYSINSEGNLFPVDQWGGLLEQASYIEIVKHLIRSYVEQPATPGVNVALLDRRDYMNRWNTVLQMEQREYDDMLDVFKIRHMGLGQPRVMVSGGVYGTFGPTRLPINAARPRYHWRFH